MSVALFLILAGALAWLWRRVDRLERELARWQDASPHSVAAAELEEPGTQDISPPAEPEAAIPAPPATVAEGEAPPRPRLDLEDLFGRQLPIWAGGVTLAVAGFFLVRWSIDAGLLTPSVRVLLAGVFGLALIAGAETAYRWRDRVADPRVAQALAGAGLATLYAAFYLAGTAYGLIGSTFAFIGLAAVTAAAIGLSYRFGLPSAVLGLVGGFAAPALVGSEQANLPLLTLYLALVTAGLAATGERQGRGWLGLAALAGGLGWGALLIFGGQGAGSSGVLGAYLVLLAGILPALFGGGGRPGWLVRIGAALLGAVQLAVLVQLGGFGALQWGLYLLLGAALAWFGWRQPAMREANAVAAIVGVVLTAFWPDPDPAGYAAVAGALAAIFAGVPLAQLWRGHGRGIDVAQASGVALGLGLTTIAQFGSVLPEIPAAPMALALALLAALPAGARVLATGPGRWRSLAEASAAMLGYAAIAQVLPHDSLAWAAGLVAAVLAWRARGLADAIAMLAVLAALSAAIPVLTWLQGGAQALAGTPLAVADLPSLRQVGLFVGPAILAVAAWAAAAADGARARAAPMWVGAVLAAIAAHIVFRHGFAGLAGDDFVATGVVQRALWEAVLVAAGWLAWRRGWIPVAVGFALAAVAHFVWFAAVLHNPLWSAQAVGPLPVANALLLAYGAAFAALFLLRRLAPAERAAARWVLDAALMGLVALLALSLLRQAFSGSLLIGEPLGQTEDLLRSLAGIVLAIAFLLWGARRGERSWRIGSLVLMVVAVLKVFLVDAAGLEGLGRIVSFMALGFSLIGIGWFYTRQLRVASPPIVTP